MGRGLVHHDSKNLTKLYRSRLLRDNLATEPLKKTLESAPTLQDNGNCNYQITKNIISCDYPVNLPERRDMDN